MTDEQQPVNPWRWPLIALASLIGCVVIGVALALAVTA
jgi:hypothetical protein